MISTLYIEEAVAQHPRTVQLQEKFPQARTIFCRNYAEVFNRKAQNFRLQKQQPALILAEKTGNLVLETPSEYGIGSSRNYYFSHMLNCLYDCRYCFLQGMYRSAHYVLFVNYEDFASSIADKIQEFPNDEATFFSGYDCDSLAMESASQFAEYFLPFFKKHPRAQLELRTKSVAVHPLLSQAAIPNVIIAFSLTPPEVAKALEHKTPGPEKRIQAIRKLQQAGWNVGLRFDPLIYTDDFKESYRSFFQHVFSSVNTDQLHSVSIGLLRFPQPIFKNIVKLYPDEKLFAGPIVKGSDGISYRKEIEEDLIHYIKQELQTLVPSDKVFHCQFN